MSSVETLSAWMDQRAEPMAELLMGLVEIDTENPPGRGLLDCATTLVEAMAELELGPELMEVSDPISGRTGWVVTGGCGDGERVVYFHGHFDVVPVQTRDQFVPRREQGRIVGRGTSDMKGGVVSMLYAAAAARDLGMLGDAQIVFHLVCDEETGSTLGAGNLQARGMISPGAVAMLTAEPTDGAVWHASRGAITAKVKVAGRAAHVGLRNQGENAFTRLLAVAEPLTRFADELLDERTAFAVADPRASGSMMVLGGALGAGANFNVVPGSAWFSIDWRFNPEQTLEAELVRLHRELDAAAEQAGAQIDVDLLQQQPASATVADHPQAIRLASCAAAVHGREPSFEMCPGVLDTRWYAQLGVPAFAYGGGRLDISHGPHEHIEEQAMRRCAVVYALFAAEVGA